MIINKKSRNARFVVLCILVFIISVFQNGEGIAAAETVYTNVDPYSSSFAVTTDFDEKISILKEEAFPEGWYWNYHSKSSLGSHQQKAVTVNGRTSYISTLGCTYGSSGYSSGQHNSNWNDGGLKSTAVCQSNKYPGKLSGRQCYGFARTIFHALWNMEEGASTTVSVKYKNDPECLSLLLPGDLLWTGSHAIVITKINHRDGSIEYVDCNSDSHCKILWNHTPERENLLYWKGVLKSNAYVSLHDPDASYANRENMGYMEAGRATDPVSGHQYILCMGSVSWSTARSYAQSLGEGYDLATMDGSSANEQQLIESLVADFGSACWLGANNLSGSWQWVSGTGISTSDSRWDDGEPSGAHSSGSTENYLGIYGDSAQTSYATINKWNDFKGNSDTIKGFVVEYTPTVSLTCPSHLTMSVGDRYRLWENVSGADGCTLLEGYGCIFLEDQDGELMVRAAEAGHALIQFEGAGSQTALMGITVMPETMYCEIYPEDESWDGTVSSDKDQAFRLYLLGPQSQYVSEPVWSISDPEAAQIVSRSDGTCTVRAVGDGSATLKVSVDILMEDGYLNPIETWTAELDLTTELIDSKTIECRVPDGDVETKLDYLRSVFLDGWYFDLWDEGDLAGELQYYIRVGDNTVGISGKPCDHTACSKYWGYMHGTRATGYARVLYNLLWNQEEARDSFMYVYNPVQGNFDFLTDLQPGDCIYTGNHNMIVTGVSGDTVYVTDCNSDGVCGIRWDAAYTMAELQEMIRDSGKGRVYTPHGKVMPSDDELTEYKVLPGQTLTVYTQPFNDSRQLRTLDEEDLFDVDLSHTYENTNASYGKGTWALCYSVPEGPGWVIISDSDVCAPNELGDRLQEHKAVTMPVGTLDLETFRNDLLNGRYEKHMTGVISGILRSVEIVIYPMNPVDIELGEAVASWSRTFTEDTRTTFDFPAEVRFTESELSSFTEGAYYCETIVRYIKDGKECEWWSVPSSPVFWLITEDTTFPTDISAESYQIESFASVDIPVDLGTSDVSLLYVGIEVLGGADKANVSWDYTDGAFVISVERIAAGTVKFDLRVANSCDDMLLKSFTVTFLDCKHENTVYFHTIPCTEEGYWSLTCVDCEMILAEGTDAVDVHDWVVTSCVAADADTDGAIGEVYCSNCYLYMTNGLVIPKDKVLRLPGSVQEIDTEAFMNTRAVQIEIAEGTQKIGSKAFAACPELSLLILPDSLSSIEDDALDGSSPVVCCSRENEYAMLWAVDHDLPVFLLE